MARTSLSIFKRFISSVALVTVGVFWLSAVCLVLYSMLWEVAPIALVLPFYLHWVVALITAYVFGKLLWNYQCRRWHEVTNIGKLIGKVALVSAYIVGACILVWIPVKLLAYTLNLHLPHRSLVHIGYGYVGRLWRYFGIGLLIGATGFSASSLLACLNTFVNVLAERVRKKSKILRGIIYTFSGIIGIISVYALVIFISTAWFKFVGTHPGVFQDYE